MNVLRCRLTAHLHPLDALKPLWPYSTVQEDMGLRLLITPSQFNRVMVTLVVYMLLPLRLVPIQSEFCLPPISSVMV